MADADIYNSCRGLLVCGMAHERTHIYLPRDLLEDVDRIAIEEDRSRSAEIARALREHIQRRAAITGAGRLASFEALAAQHHTPEETDPMSDNNSMRTGVPGGMKVGARDRRIENSPDGVVPDKTLRGLPNQERIFGGSPIDRAAGSVTPTSRDVLVRDPWSTTEKGGAK